jgi:hypothetical protein
MVTQQFPRGLTWKQVRSALHEAHAQFEALEDAWETLVEEHEDEWVASFDDKFVFGDTIEEVLRRARRRGWPVDRIAIDHLSRDRPAVLL